MVIFALLLSAAAQQQINVSPGGTNPQGATGGMTQDGHVMQGPAATPRAPGDGVTSSQVPWNSPLPQGNQTPSGKQKKARRK